MCRNNGCRDIIISLLRKEKKKRNNIAPVESADVVAQFDRVYTGRHGHGQQ
jgi:hypothetical protein